MTIKVQDGGLLGYAPQPITIGIDQSYTGFAITAMAEDGKAVYHSWVFKSSGEGIRRLLTIEDFLADTLLGLVNDGYRLRATALEGYAFGSQRANMAGELGSIVKRTLFVEFDIEPMIVAPTSLKKYAAGKGTGVAKQHMLLSIYKKWGAEFRDDNMADAYALARLASRRVDHDYEREVLKRIDQSKEKA